MTVAGRAGFVVQDILVEGRQQTSAKEILTAMGVRQGDSIFKFTPASVRQRLERLPWIQSATVQRRLPNSIYVRLVERRPVVLWQNKSKLYLVDHDGSVIENFDPKEFSHLLVVVGKEAPRRIPRLLAELDKVPEIKQRVTAAILVAGRRWDLMIDKKLKVKLPETDIAKALHHLAQLDQLRQLRGKHIETIDIRLPDRSFVYVSPQGVAPKLNEKKNHT